MSDYHIPVLLEESVRLLGIKHGDIVVDCTLGGGGHTNGFLEAVGSSGKVIAIDRDKEAIGYVSKLLGESDNLILVHDNYSNLEEILGNLGVNSVDAIFADLGVSSYQLDTAGRGFAFRSPDSKLDMRMSYGKGLTAADILNAYDVKGLDRIFTIYGQEKFSKKIVSEIEKRRKIQKFEKVSDLLDILGTKIHPKRVFQALRIEVNKEFEHLDRFLKIVPKLLKKGGRLGMITFHGLEERLIRENMKIFTKASMEEALRMELVTKQAILPCEEELKVNPRARSAKLKVFGKV